MKKILFYSLIACLLFQIISILQSIKARYLLGNLCFNDELLMFCGYGIWLKFALFLPNILLIFNKKYPIKENKIYLMLLLTYNITTAICFIIYGKIIYF